MDPFGFSLDSKLFAITNSSMTPPVTAHGIAYNSLVYNTQFHIYFENVEEAIRLLLDFTLWKVEKVTTLMRTRLKSQLYWEIAVKLVIMILETWMLGVYRFSQQNQSEIPCIF